MKLRLKQGAVVRFELIGSGEPIYKIGKVDGVYEDEVVLIEQMPVTVEDDDNIMSLMCLKYHSSKTVDWKEIHINRALISSWEYVKIDETYIVPLYEVPPVPENCTFTEYDESGYCFGSGEDFSDVPDESSSYLIVGKKKEDDLEGLELSL